MSNINENGPIYHTNDHVGIQDCTWNRDGTMFIISDNNGRWSMYGNENSDFYNHIPPEMYFTSDYESVTETKSHNIIDTATKMACHLLPHVFCESNGNMYKYFIYYLLFINIYLLLYSYNVPPPYPLDRYSMTVEENIKRRRKLREQTRQLEIKMRIESDSIESTEQSNTNNNTPNRNRTGRVLYYYIM